ncbi:helix-hairpin-helix domain-containing protein [Marinobacter lipolyticus]|uniref:helix-hairpin-helix domain-containing protein n=1 Tax=Marinobacter lipolyticus TaxID=209639 RepID=UPI003A8E8237
MAKKAKPSVDKIVKKVNKEFDKTSSQIEKLINDALKQFDSLQNQIQEPVRKLLKEVDELRDREMKRFNEEFERRLNEFHELQNSILDRLGIASKEAKKEIEKTADSASAKVSAAKSKAAKSKATKPKTAAKPAAKKPAAKKAPAKTVAKPKPQTTAKKAPAKKAAKPVNKNDLTRVKGIGPATAKKMQEAGINSIEQIATPSDADKEKLQAFSKIKGFATLSDEAKKVL